MMAVGLFSTASADRYFGRTDYSPDIEVWTNKGFDATYHYGEDVAVYFRAEQDCYVVVYDIDPSGDVTVLFPTSYYGSTWVRGGEIYRVPGYDDDFTLEVTGGHGVDRIYAVASYEYINPPDFVRYIGYDYGSPDYYDDNYFVLRVSGDHDDFVRYVNNRICHNPHSVAYTRFHVNSNYRHHVHYRYYDYDPYNYGSLWVGMNYPGCEVWIDGVYFGIAPLLIPRIYIGHHWIWMYYGGYPCYQQYFYVSYNQRYYIHGTFHNRFKDHRHRRRSFREWTFYEKKHRNEKDFRIRANKARSHKVRHRSVPSGIITDLNKKGAIRENTPMFRRIEYSDKTRSQQRINTNRDNKYRNDSPKTDRNTKNSSPEYNTRNSKDLKSKTTARKGETYKSTDNRYDERGKLKAKSTNKHRKTTANKLSNSKSKSKSDKQYKESKSSGKQKTSVKAKSKKSSKSQKSTVKSKSKTSSSRKATSSSKSKSQQHKSTKSSKSSKKSSSERGDRR
jgi:hypothetical protein